MASKAQRDEAIRRAVETVHDWPRYMHRAQCRCAKCVGDSACSCRACRRTRLREHFDAPDPGEGRSDYVGRATRPAGW